jgi:small-conductance mechanosensitive channel
MIVGKMLKERSTILNINKPPVSTSAAAASVTAEKAIGAKELLPPSSLFRLPLTWPIKWAAPSPKMILPAAKTILAAFGTKELFVYLFFRLTYSKMLRTAHKAQTLVWSILALGRPLEWNKSILGFAEENCALLTKLMGGNYMVGVVVTLLQKLGFRINDGFPILVSKVVYTFYIANFIDLFKAKYLTVFMPNLSESRRQSYVVNRSISVVLWIVAFLTACEMVSTFLKVPLSSTLAFGGVGGLAIGLSARDIAANFLGGMLLLFNEPFTPGDMVTFRHNKQDITGRVERVGWGQTRLRGRDTRPTYVPNSHFVQTAVTNMERITHRRFDSILNLRYEDAAVVPDVLANVKDALRVLPKLDTLSMPFRVSLVRFSEYSLVIEIQCYFATKSIDEFLALQQMANLEILRVVRGCGAALALPSSVVSYTQAPKKEKTTVTAGTGIASALSVAQNGSLPVALKGDNKLSKVSKTSSSSKSKPSAMSLPVDGITGVVPKTATATAAARPKVGKVPKEAGAATQSRAQQQPGPTRTRSQPLNDATPPAAAAATSIEEASPPMLAPPTMSPPPQSQQQLLLRENSAMQPTASGNKLRDLYDPVIDPEDL